MNIIRCSHCSNEISSTFENPCRIHRLEDGIWETFCPECEAKYLTPMEPIDPSRIVWEGIVHADGSITTTTKD